MAVPQEPFIIFFERQSLWSLPLILGWMVEKPQQSSWLHFSCDEITWVIYHACLFTRVLGSDSGPRTVDTLLTEQKQTNKKTPYLLHDFFFQYCNLNIIKHSFQIKTIQLPVGNNFAYMMNLQTASSQNHMPSSQSFFFSDEKLLFVRLCPNTRATVFTYSLQQVLEGLLFYK